jgi:hypothetical protein
MNLVLLLNIWIADGSCFSGILLLDPTVEEGFPIWRQGRNWDPIPSMHATSAPKAGPPNTSLFEDVVHWTTKPYSPLHNLHAGPKPEELIPIQAFLHVVCAEWLIMISYLSTRLGQLEWEISFPEQFGVEDAADGSLQKLHVWRRLIPLYIEMLQDTLSRVFNFPPSTLNSSMEDSSNQKSMRASEATLGPILGPRDFHLLQPSFANAMAKMEKLQDRLNRLSAITTGAITIAESRLSYAESRNISRLSWLATIYIPLTFITGLFSIQPDIPQLAHSFKYFFAVAIPLAALTLAIAVVGGYDLLGVLKDVLHIAKSNKKIHKADFVFYGKEIKNRRKIQTLKI